MAAEIAGTTDGLMEGLRSWAEVRLKVTDDTVAAHKVAEEALVAGVAKVWKGRTIALWRPLHRVGAAHVDINAITPRAALKVFEAGHTGPTSHWMGEGLLVSGVILDLNFDDEVSIGLENGSYREFKRTEGKAGDYPIIAPEPETHVEFERAWLEGLFQHPRGAEEGVLLATVAMREVSHPHEITTYPMPVQG
jgi:hypothetical protein